MAKLGVDIPLLAMKILYQAAVFISRSAHSARTAGPIRLLYVFHVCLFVCVFEVDGVH